MGTWRPRKPLLSLCSLATISVTSKLSHRTWLGNSPRFLVTMWGEWLLYTPLFRSQGKFQGDLVPDPALWSLLWGSLNSRMFQVSVNWQRCLRGGGKERARVCRCRWRRGSPAYATGGHLPSAFAALHVCESWSVEPHLGNFCQSQTIPVTMMKISGANTLCQAPVLNPTYDQFLIKGGFVFVISFLQSR